eukprot:SAG31_NODE_598_length_13651_cov_10.681818_8_plen_344_part_00
MACCGFVVYAFRALAKRLHAAGQPGPAIEALLTSLGAEDRLPRGDPLRTGRPAAIVALASACCDEAARLLARRRCTEACAVAQIGLDWIELQPHQEAAVEFDHREKGRRAGGANANASETNVENRQGTGATISSVPENDCGHPSVTEDSGVDDEKDNKAEKMQADNAEDVATCCMNTSDTKQDKRIETRREQRRLPEHDGHRKKRTENFQTVSAAVPKDSLRHQLSTLLDEAKIGSGAAAQMLARLQDSGIFRTTNFSSGDSAIECQGQQDEQLAAWSEHDTAEEMPASNAQSIDLAVDRGTSKQWTHHSKQRNAGESVIRSMWFEADVDGSGELDANESKFC